tara:strand:- start:152 stop:847 length:696 start_codon:yes stop_codon:yes gene_type:complete
MAKGFGISADILVPDLTFEVTNELQTVAGMAAAISQAVKAATKAGKDAHGKKMSKPKDAGSKENPNGKALKRTGRLIANITHEKKKARKSKTGKKPQVRYAVKSGGKRPADENVAAKKKRARDKTKQARAAAVLGEAFGTLSGRGISSDFQRKKRGSGIKLSKIRFRTADTNAALAGILSAEPKDKRAKAGNRAQYRVFVASARYVNIGEEKANKLMRYKLGEKRKIRVKR